MNIIDKINEFHKLCLASHNLSSLLKEALATGNRDTYLVFLDALEEQMPDVKKSLVTSKYYEGPLKVLSKHFPNIISNSGSNYYFLDVLLFGEIDFITYGPFFIQSIYYKDKFTWHPTYITFYSPLANRIQSIYHGGEAYDENDHLITEQDPNEAKSIFNKFNTKVQDDIEKLYILV